MRIIFVFCIFSITVNAQHKTLINTGDPENVVVENDASNPCISPQEYSMIEKRCGDNIKALHINDQASKSAQSVTLLQWPLQSSANLHDCSYYHLSAYVDQNTTTGAFQDFNCGTNSYDGHGGTDISTWPYNFLKMDNNLVEVVAASSGIIIDKHDGEFDRNCTSNSLTANYVIIQHGDGSVALYWHMKKNSITTVAIGQPVAVGDYLGVVGSSGSSSGPHLHFEVWGGSSAATRVDPYYGSCNLLNGSSWWAVQKPAKETGLEKVSVNTTDAIVPTCPTTETPNESSIFQIPFQGLGLAPGYAKFYIFIRDEVNGLNADLSILNPNGSTYLSWTYNSTSDNKVRTWAYSKVLPTIDGTYTFRAIYNGDTCSTDFEITHNAVGLEDEYNSQFKIYPNPSTGAFILETNSLKNQSIEIYNMMGEKIFESEITELRTSIVINNESGVYFYQLSDKLRHILRGKLFIKL